MIIDAHQHFWRLGEAEQPWRRDDHHRIARDYLPNDLITAAAGTPVTGTVLVESVDGPAENDRLAVFAEQPPVVGVVGWLPLADPAAARRELDRMAVPTLSGVRCLIGAAPIAWTRDPEVRALFAELAGRGLAWDVVPVTAEQAAAVIDLAVAVPELKIVLDHLARPPIETAGWQPWADQVARLADLPSVAIKLSIGLDVLSAWESWQADALPRYVEWAIRRFGPERCMLASNWPVVELRAPYARAWHDVGAVAAAVCDAPGLAEISGGTARRWYGLPDHPPSRGNPTPEGDPLIMTTRTDSTRADSTATYPTKADPDRLGTLYRYLRVVDVVDALDGIGYFNIGLVSPELRPIWSGMRFFGEAATIRAVPSNKPMWKLDTTEDIVAAHGRWFAKYPQAKLPTDLAPGHVVVMDSGGGPETGYWGSENSMGAILGGAVGIVTDGYCRDTAELATQRTPIVSRHRGRTIIPGRIEAIETQTTIACGGAQVNPGDIVGADDDGVVVVPKEVAHEVATHARAILLSDMRARRSKYERLGLPHDPSIDADAVEAYYDGV